MIISTRYYLNAEKSADRIRYRHKFDDRNRKPLLSNIHQFSGRIVTNTEYDDDGNHLCVQIIIRDDMLNTNFITEFAIPTNVCSTEIKEIHTQLDENNNWILILIMDDDYLHVVNLSGIEYFISIPLYFRNDLVKFHPSLLTTLVKLDCYESDTQFNVSNEVFV